MSGSSTGGGISPSRARTTAEVCEDGVAPAAAKWVLTASSRPSGDGPISWTSICRHSVRPAVVSAWMSSAAISATASPVTPTSRCRRLLVRTWATGASAASPNGAVSRS